MRYYTQKEKETISRFSMLQKKLQERKYHLDVNDRVAREIWNYVYEELLKFLTCNPMLTKTHIIELEVIDSRKRIIVKIYKTYGATFKGFVIDSPDSEKIISDLNLVLAYYGISLQEIPDGKQNTKYRYHRIYTVEFVNSN